MQMERLSFMYSHPDSSRPVSEENRLFVSAILEVLNSPLSRFYFWLSPTFLLSNLKHLNIDLNIPANCLGYFLILCLLCSVLQTLQFSFWERIFLSGISLRFYSSGWKAKERFFFPSWNSNFEPRWTHHYNGRKGRRLFSLFLSFLFHPVTENFSVNRYWRSASRA